MKKQLTVIGRATEYCVEYMRNGFDQIGAYMHAHGVCYDTAKGIASRFHNSPQCQEAFSHLIGDSVQQYYRSRDGITLRAQEIYDSCLDNATRLKCLRFIAELAGYLKQDLNIDARQITVSISKDKEVEIVNKLKNIGRNAV